MGITVGAALKKVAAAILTEPKVLKNILFAILVVSKTGRCRPVGLRPREPLAGFPPGTDADPFRKSQDSNEPSAVVCGFS